MGIAADDKYTLEVGTWNGTAAETLRFSGSGPGGFTTGVSDTPPSTNYPARIGDSVMLARTAFAARRTTGQAQPSAGELTVWNGDGALDYLRGYSFDGRSAVMYRGKSPATYPSGWTKTLDATMHAAEWTTDGIRLNVRDAQKYAAMLYQPTLYAGNNVAPDGLEGTADDLKGKPKPHGFGYCFNAPVPCVNPDKLIYELHDGVIASVDDVRDGGESLVAGMTWTSRNPGFTGQAAHGCAIADDGTMVTVGSGGAGIGDIAVSTDGGATWSHYTVTAGGQFNKVHWANGLFVAVGDNNQIYTSTTAANAGAWTLRTTPSAGQILTDATYGVVTATGVATWLVVGLAGLTRTSTNGTTWANGTTVGSPTNLNGVAYGISNNTGLFVAAANGASLFTSPDAVTWTARTGAVSNLNHVDYGNGAWVMVGGAGVVQSSLDAITWTARQSLVSVNISALRYGNGRWLYGTAGGDLVTSLDGGVNWTALTLGIAGPPNIQAVAYGNNTFLLSGSTNFAATSAAAGQTYANATDLQDDTLAPSAGTYKVLSSSGGSYIRLGLKPEQTLTVDFTVGATSADRTYAQGWAMALARAGLSAGSSAGNYSSADVTARDAENNAVVGRWTGPNDANITCGDIAAEFAETGGAWMNADGGGVIRLKRLNDPSPNIVPNPNSLNSGAWSGAGTYTNNFARYDGHSFSRIQGNGSTTQRSQSITLTGNGVKQLKYRTNNYAGGTGQNVVMIYDSTAVVPILWVDETYHSDGTITFAIGFGVYGTGLRSVRLKNGSYDVTVLSNSATAAHAHLLYASNIATVGSGGVTDWAMSDFRIYDTLPVATITEDDMFGNPEPVASEDDNEGIPNWQTAIQWGRNYTVQTVDQLEGDVSPANRVRFGLEWRTATAEDSGVLTAHPLSKQLSVDTLYTQEADALTEAARRQSVLGADRQWLEVTVEMSDAFAAIELGDIVDATYWRYGLGAGTRFAVMGVAPHAQPGQLTTITFTLWGDAAE